MVIEYPFRNLNNKVFPDLKNYKFNISLNIIDTQVEIVEGWALGNLYVKINEEFICPFRINTNLLPPTHLSTTKFYYDYNKQAFIFEYNN